MKTVRQYEQHMGYNVPEGAHRVKRQTVSRGGEDIFRSSVNMSSRIGRTDDKAKGRKRDVNKGDGM